MADECAAELLQLWQVAEALRVDVDTVARWINYGRMDVAGELIRLPVVHAPRRGRYTAQPIQVRRGDLARFISHFIRRASTHALAALAGAR